jgi:hypothetical protein
MKLLRTIRRSLGRRSAAKREIDEELRFHVERRTDENIASGMPHEDGCGRATLGHIEDCHG